LGRSGGAGAGCAASNHERWHAGQNQYLFSRVRTMNR
jgi:hypothetical protein